MSLYERYCARRSKYSPTPDRPVKSRPMKGREGWRSAEPCSCTSGVGVDVKCARMTAVEPLEEKVEMRERMEERRAGRGVGIVSCFPSLLLGCA